MSTLASTAPAGIEPPTPTADLDSKFHWDGLREHRMLAQCCGGCGRVRFPPMPTCPYCASPAFTIQEISGEGKVYSWIVVHRAFAQAFASQVPYTLATVELKEGCRIVGRFEGSKAPEFGMDVRAVYFDHAEWTEIRFTAQEKP